MTYVDDMARWVGPKRVCHLIADTDAELQAMAQHLDIVGRVSPLPYYYEVSMSERAQAVKAGAQEITWRQFGEMCAQRRQAGTGATSAEDASDAP